MIAVYTPALCWAAEVVEESMLAELDATHLDQLLQDCTSLEPGIEFSVSLQHSNTGTVHIFEHEFTTLYWNTIQ